MSFFFRSVLFAVACVVWVSESAELPPKLWLDKQYTVSGISSGAFMAVQMSTIFSSRVAGVGVFAGGPYYCSKGLSVRLSYCTAFPVVPGVGRLSDEVDDLADAVRQFSQMSLIDAFQNVTKQKFFLFSGTLDSVVSPQVPQVAAEVWRALGAPNDSIVTKFDLRAGHTFPTIDHGGACTSSSAPYIGACQFDGAGALFAHIVPGGVPVARTTKPTLSRIIKVDQASFIPNDSSLFSTDLASEAFLFLPAACADASKRCRLHVAFHGCTMSGDVFPRQAGYVEWAETNDIVVLFPQINGHGSNLVTGCWDFTGSYTNSEFYRRDGLQTGTVARLIDHLSSGVPNTVATTTLAESTTQASISATSSSDGTLATTSSGAICDPACASGQLCVQSKCYAEVGDSTTTTIASTSNELTSTTAPTDSAAAAGASSGSVAAITILSLALVWIVQ